jgi:hypothetical protein
MKTFIHQGKPGVVERGPIVRFDDSGIEKELDYDGFITSNSGPAEVGDAVTVTGGAAHLIQDPQVQWDEGIEQDVSMGIIENLVPTATVVSHTGTLQDGQTLTGVYTYTDNESDLEGNSTYRWLSDDDGAGTNKAVISGATLQTYLQVVGDVTKHIYFEVTPVAITGTIVGLPVESAARGPVIA